MTLELPVIPRPGEVILAIELNTVQNMTVAQTLKLLEELGYKPSLRYRQSQDGNISVYAVLKHENIDPLILQNSDYLGEELDKLAELIQPKEAIISPRGISSAQAHASV